MPTDALKNLSDSDLLALSEKRYQDVSDEGLMLLDSGKKPAYDFLEDISASSARGAARILGFPADMVRLTAEGVRGGANLLGYDFDIPPWLDGTNNIVRGMELMGIDATPDQQGVMGRVMEETTSALGPMTLLGRAAQIPRAFGKNPAAPNPMVESFRKAPGAMTSAEASAAVSAAVTGYGAEQVFDSPYARSGGELVGGALNPASLAYNATRSGKDKVKTIVEAHSKRGRKKAAARTLQEYIREAGGDPGTLAERVQPSDGVTAPQQTADPSLLSLEQAIIKKDPERYQQYLKSMRGQAEDAVAEMSPGAPRDATNFYRQEVETAKKGLTARLQSAEAAAQSRVDKLSPQVTREQAGRIWREELKKAFSEAKAHEKVLWEKTDLSVPVDTTPLRQAYDEALAMAEKSSAPLPEWVNNHFSKKGKTKFNVVESRSAIKAFRTRLMDEMDSITEGPGKKPNRELKARPAVLEQAAFDAMAAGEDPAVAAARAWSRHLNQTFREGTVGEVRASTRSGGDAVQAGDTLEVAIGNRTGPTAGTRVDELNDAVQSSRGDAALVDFVRHRASQSAVDPLTGQLDPKSAAAFQRDNAAVMERYPEVSSQVTDATDARIAANRRADSVAGYEKMADRSIPAQYAGGREGERVWGVLNAKDPQKAVDALVRRARKDNSGKAFAGLKRDYLNELWSRAEKVNGVTGDLEMKASALVSNLRESQPFWKHLSKGERERLAVITDRAVQMERQLHGGRPLESLIDPEGDMVIDLLSRLIGANVGGSGMIGNASGASLVMAGHGSRVMRRLTEKIPMERITDVLQDAVYDPKLFKDLLEMNVRSPKAVTKIEQRLHAYLAGTAPVDETDQAQ